GREGSGPGEFQWLGLIGLDRTNLWALDARRWLVTRFSIAGGLPVSFLEINTAYSELNLPPQSRESPPTFLGYSASGIIWELSGQGGKRTIVVTSAGVGARTLIEYFRAPCAKQFDRPNGPPVSIGIPFCARP